MNLPVRLLLIDDASNDRLLILQELHRTVPDLQVEQITTADGFAQAIAQGTFDMVIMDSHLHWSDGLSILRTVKARRPDCPVIMFTDTTSDELAMEAMKAGLDDYMVKAPLHYACLPLVVQSAWAKAQHHRALQEAEGRYLALFENANDIIGTCTLEGTITSVNRAAEFLLGWSREEMVGQLAHRFLTPDSAVVVVERTRRTLAGEHLPSTFAVEAVHKNGSVVPLETRVRFMRDTVGIPVGYQGIARDISTKKALEQQRTEFLAMLTHDIKNPLGVILGYTELLIEGIKERGTLEDIELLERLRSNAFTINALVTNYLDLSRIEAGHLAITKRPLAINDILRRVRYQYEARARRRQITLELQLQEALPAVMGDSLALERIFTNLVHNALKLTPAFGRVTLSSALHGDVIAEVVAAVTDTAGGISPEEMSVLFEKYRHITRSRNTEGIGLGLFIVKALVEAQNGRIEVESTRGQGSRFSVFLPTVSAAL